MAKTPPKPAKPSPRSARLAAALRANLKRRKTQARHREDVKTAPESPKNET